MIYNYRVYKITGCNLCPYLIHKHGTAICLASGDILEIKPVYRQNTDGDRVEYPPAPVPSQNCAYKE